MPASSHCGRLASWTMSRVKPSFAPVAPTLACRATRSVAAAPSQSTQASRMDVDATDVNLWDPETTIPAHR
jgi:hypothetical protein